MDSSGYLAKKILEIKKRCIEEFGLPHSNADIIKIENFMNWIREGGAIFKGIRMKYYEPDFRGVHAVQEIKQSEIFLNVPQNLIISPKLGKETPIGSKVLNSGVRISWDYLSYIAIFLMTEMHNPESKWKPYLDIYPRMVNGFPMFYTEAEKLLLKGTPMLEHIESELEQIKEEYKRIITAVPEFKEFSEEEYIKNKILVISRIFYVKINGVIERIMVPLAGYI